MPRRRKSCWRGRSFWRRRTTWGRLCRCSTATTGWPASRPRGRKARRCGTRSCTSCGRRKRRPERRSTRPSRKATTSARGRCFESRWIWTPKTPPISIRRAPWRRRCAITPRPSRFSRSTWRFRARWMRTSRCGTPPDGCCPYWTSPRPPRAPALRTGSPDASWPRGFTIVRKAWRFSSRSIPWRVIRRA